MKRERGSIKKGDATGLESLFPLVASARSIDEERARVCVCVCVCVCKRGRTYKHMSKLNERLDTHPKTEAAKQAQCIWAGGQLQLHTLPFSLALSLSLSLSLSHTHTHTQTHTVLPVLAYCPTRNEDWGPIALRAEDSLWIDFQYATRGLSKTESRIILPPSPPLPALPHFLFSPSHRHSPLSLFSRSFHPFIPLRYRSLFPLSTGCLCLPLCFHARSSFDSVRLHTSVFFHFFFSLLSLRLCLKTIYHSVLFFFLPRSTPPLPSVCLISPSDGVLR